MLYALGLGTGQGLQFAPSYTAAVTMDSTYYVAIQDAFNSAIQGFETYFAQAASAITITIGEGKKRTYATTVGTDLSDYDTYLNELKNDETINNSFVSLGLRYDGSGPDNPINGDQYIQITDANIKALGYIPEAATSDGTILLNPSQLYFPAGLTKTAAAAQTPQFQFSHLNAVTVIESQIVRIMGMDSGYNYSSSGFNEPEPEDLYRYTAPGVFATTGGQSAYFSLSGGTDPLDDFNTTQDASTGANYSDWLPNSEISEQLEDAGGDPDDPPGLQPLAAELLILQTLGWTPAQHDPPGDERHGHDSPQRRSNR